MPFRNPLTSLPASAITGQLSTSQISPGAITAALLAAGAVTATAISPGAVSTPALAAGSVTAAQLVAGAVTASAIAAGAINGQTITGALVQTAATGQRVLLSGANSDLEVYNSAGTQVVSLGGANGALTLGNPSAAHILLDPTVPVENLYDAAGHLVAQLDPVGGALTMLDNGTNLRAIRIGKSAVTFAPISAAGTLPTTAQLNSGGSVTGSTGALTLASGYAAGSNGVTLGLASNTGTTYPTAPVISIGDQLVTTPVLVTLAGAMQFAQPGFYAPGWQTPSLGTGWATSALRAARALSYRIDAEDNLVMCGAVNITTLTNLANPVFTVPAAYCPKNNIPFLVLHENSAGSEVNVCSGFITTGGGVSLYSDAPLTVGDIFTLNATLPLGNLP